MLIIPTVVEAYLNLISDVTVFHNIFKNLPAKIDVAVDTIVLLLHPHINCLFSVAKFICRSFYEQG